MVDHVPAGRTDVILLVEDTETVTIRGQVVRTDGEPVHAYQIDGAAFQQSAFEVERNVQPAPIALAFVSTEHGSKTVMVDVSGGKDVDLGQVSAS